MSKPNIIQKKIQEWITEPQPEREIPIDIIIPFFETAIKNQDDFWIEVFKNYIGDFALPNIVLHQEKIYTFLTDKSKEPSSNPLLYYFWAILHQPQYHIHPDKRIYFDFITKAADKGSSYGICALGFHYMNFTMEIDKAIKQFEKGIEMGNPMAFNNLGYETGDGIEKNLEKSYQYYRKSADLGCALAFANIGIHYRDGLHFDLDEKKGQEYFLIGAKLGSEFAMETLRDSTDLSDEEKIYWKIRSCLASRKSVIENELAELKDTQLASRIRERITKDIKKRPLLLKLWEDYNLYQRKITLVLLGRKYCRDSLFYHDYLPLDVFKIIISFVEY